MSHLCFRTGNHDDDNDEEKAVGFAAELAAMDAEEEDYEDNGANDSPGVAVVGPEQRFDTNEKWARPPLPPGVGTDSKKTICMQIIDLDHAIGELNCPMLAFVCFWWLFICYVQTWARGVW
jgi:hypothetical protein